VEVLVRQTKRAFVLEVRDNGSGIPHDPAARQPTGLGFAIMRHHATRAGLQFSVGGASEKGTIIKAIYRTSVS
jgi:nitrate/nitrite-specific signal transduction histidine kinase